MSYNKFINNFNSIYKKNSIKWKYKLSKQIKKGHFIELGYHEHEKEDIKLETISGHCTLLKIDGINTKLKLILNFKKKIYMVFFLYNMYLYDIKRIYTNKKLLTKKKAN